MAHFTDSLIEDFELQEAKLDYSTELAKIQKWRGTGKRNIAAMSNEKLKFNYDICIDKGYSHEAAILKHEGRIRRLKWALFVPPHMVKLGPGDFVLPELNFVNTNINDPNTIISAYSRSSDPVRTGIILIILTILAGHPEIGEKLRNAMITDYNISSASIKDAIEKLLTDNAIVDKLDKLLKSTYVDESLALIEKVEKHDILNPKLWNEDNTLKPEVAEKINEIVDSFLKALEEDEIKINVEDIRLVGSNCSYNYNDKSDLDIHIIADTDSLGCPDNLYPLLYSAYRSIWNKNHDVTLYGIPAEIFVETSDTEQESEENTLQESLNKDFYSELPACVCEQLAAIAKKYKKETWFEKAWEEYRQHILKSSMDDMKMPGFIFKKYIKESLNEDLVITEARKQTALKSNGIYSVMQNKWIKEPVAEDIPEVDQSALDELVAEWEAKYKAIKETPSTEQILSYIEAIYDMRRKGIESSEYSLENLCFKEIRNKGILDELKELKNEVETKDLSLESLEEDTKKLKDHKWVNKGKDGVHGTFRTKKAADAQRKAMYANGYAESFSEKQRREYETELNAATFNKAILQDNGLFNVYNIKEDDINSIMYKLNKLDFIEWVQKSAGRFDFSAPMFGNIAKRYYNIYGKIKD